MRTLYYFEADFGRMGTIDSIFVADDKEVKEAIGKTAYFGEILGKHSDIIKDLEEKDFIVTTTDQDFIDKFIKIFGKYACGYNPLEYID